MKEGARKLVRSAGARCGWFSRDPVSHNPAVSVTSAVFRKCHRASDAHQFPADGLHPVF
jgi:hypothetical protein